MRIIPALGAFFVLIALAISGCGSSGSVPDGAVASMAGNTISTQAFNHWMFVAAKEQASQSPGQPVIVPNDPPNFNKCLSTVRAEIPALKKTSDKQLRADCKQLFTSLSSQVMDFLIKAYWYQADAHKMGIKVTDAQVQTALAAAKKGQFSTATQFNAFLSSTGQTVQDVTYRVRIQQIYTKLLAKHPTTVTPAQISAFYQSHISQFGTPELRNMKIVLTKTQAAGEHGSEGPEVRHRAGPRSPRSTRSTPPPRTRAACWPTSARVSRMRRSPRRRSAPVSTSCSARSRASSATTCSR